MTTNKPGLRYVNETVGAMVLIALSLFILGVILAGKAQGWFEGRVEIHAVFMDADGKSSAEQGSFDLQEGDEVKIRSAKAGRVKSIEPLDDGGLMAVLEIKERFHRYVSVDSVARVKKMFGLAGDTHIEITEGQGEQIADGGVIACYKDKELMEIAKKAVEQLQAAVVPMVDEASGVMSNANKIAGDLSGGEGLLGTMITDPTLTADVREAINHLNEILAEAGATVHETRRLIKGAQKHWLIRKYIPEKEASEFISPLYGFYAKTEPDLYRKCEAELTEARKTADAGEIARTAYNLAACMYGNGEAKDAAVILREADLSGRRDPVSVAHNEALRALIHQEDKSWAASYASIGVLERPPKGMPFDGHSEFIAAAYLLLANTGDETKAKEVEDTYWRKVEKKGTSAAKAAFYRGMARLAVETPRRAGELSDREASELSTAGLLYGMANALERGAAYFARADEFEKSSLRYLAAAKSLHAQGFINEGAAAMKKALDAAQRVDDKALASHIEGLQALLD